MTIKRFILACICIAMALPLAACADEPVNDRADSPTDSDITEAADTENTDTEDIVSEDKISNNDKVVALTFDDGPNTSTTVAVLDVLAEYDIPATFFVIGDKINEESGKVMQRAVEQGCEIGNHSKTHQYMSKFSADEVIKEIEYVQEQVEKYTGTVPKFFRAPFIDVSQTMHDNIDLTFIIGYGCNDWDASVTAEQRVEMTLDAAQDGVIFAMHDFVGNNNTVEAIKTVIPTLLEQGYKFVTLSELFELKGVALDPDSDKSYSIIISE